MTKLELDSYRQMSPQAMRSWLVRSCVVAGSMAAALLVIAVSHFGRVPGPDVAGAPPATELSSASELR
jgi:hypothetical protein